MKKYILPTVTSFVLILISVVATLSLFNFNEQILNLSSRLVTTHQFLLPQTSATFEAETESQPVSDQIIRVHLPEALFQKQLALVLVAAPFGLENRDYEHASDQVCGHGPDTPALVSPAQETVESIADWAQLQDEISSPTSEPYVISLRQPSVALDNYVLEANQGDFLEMQPDPTVACTTPVEDTQLSW